MLDSLWKERFQLFKFSGKKASSFIQMTLSSHCCFDSVVIFFLFACFISLQTIYTELRNLTS